MNRTPVISSNLRSVGYDSATRTLEIQFIKSGIYQYFDVSAEAHAGLMIAYSKGRYFDTHIKPRYRYRKVG